MQADPSKLCAVVLAAGSGTRLRPLTAIRPKPLCPVGHQTLLERAFAELADIGLTGPDHVAVNAHHLAGQITEASSGRAHLSYEPTALGTAGAIGKLRDWIGGRDVLIFNGDAYRAEDGLGSLINGWVGIEPRLAVVDTGMQFAVRRDFGRWGFAGASLLPWQVAKGLHPKPSGLYEVVWRSAFNNKELDLAPFNGIYIDCGTPSSYLAANLHACGGKTVVGKDAIVRGRAARCVIWPQAQVEHDEDLVEAIRIGAATTVAAPQSRGNTRVARVLQATRYQHG